MSESSFFLLLAADENRWSGLILLLVLILPVLGRVLRALLERFGVNLEQDPRTATRRSEARRAEVELERGEIERRTAEGEDLWRRLLQGEEASPPPAAPLAPVTVRTQSPEAAPREVAHGDEVEIPRPLSVIGEVGEPGEAPEVSLETAGEPEPLAALAQLGAQAAPAVARKRLTLEPRNLRQAVLFSEILGPPLALRGQHRDAF